MAKSDNPYSTGFSSGEINYDLDPIPQMRKYKEEEDQTHYAPETLPVELSSLPNLFANMVDNGFQASKALNSVLKSKNFNHKKELAILKRNVDKMITYLAQNVDKTLRKQTIGYKDALNKDHKDFSGEE